MYYVLFYYNIFQFCTVNLRNNPPNCSKLLLFFGEKGSSFNSTGLNEP